MQKVFFPNLDGLRFFAFFTVFMGHVLPAEIVIGQTESFLPLRLHNALFNSAWAGVSFFFVLSGFLITYLLLMEKRETGEIDVKAFYMRRVLRIWPLYYIVLFLGFVIYPLMKAGTLHTEGVHPILYVLFLSNFDLLASGQGSMFVNITWSVAIEEQFYLAWPLLLIFTPERFYKHLFVLIILGSGAFRYLHIENNWITYFHTLSVISDMAVGAMAAYFAVRSEAFKDRIARLPRWAIFALYCVGFLLILFRQDIFRGGVAGASERLVLSLFFIFIVLEQNYASHRLKMKRLKVISKLGIYTYGLYLLHPLALALLGRGQGLTFRFVFGLALSILISVASYHLFEQRFLRLKQRFAHVKSH